ncbi:MAG: 50S ribosomal protein L6 [Desulfobulbaceae bacterium]|nr:50S ribosomal protein L6 [Desulfobulbaceae bacterium]
MSRIGKKPIPIPKGVEVKINDGSVTVKGPKGSISRLTHAKVGIEVGEGNVMVSVADGSRGSRSLHGLYGALISNMVSGVSKEFEKVLEIVGVGYKAEVKDRSIVLNLGFSHPVNFDLPDGISAAIDKNKITLLGIDKELLGQTAAKIRGLRPPEPYKGKGLRYTGEHIRKKAGKTGAK